MITADDLPFYQQYIKSIDDKTLKIALLLPQDFISLLKENARLSSELKRYKSIEHKLIFEYMRADNAEGKLKYLKMYCKDHKIDLPSYLF